MVDEEITDGTRLAELLSSELTGHETPPYDRIAVANADPDVEPTTAGDRAYDVFVDGEVLAAVYVMPERARVEVRSGLESSDRAEQSAEHAELTATERAAREAGLRTRPVGGRPPKLLVFVENGADVKRAFDVLGAAVDAA